MYVRSSRPAARTAQRGAGAAVNNIFPPIKAVGLGDSGCGHKKCRCGPYFNCFSVPTGVGSSAGSTAIGLALGIGAVIYLATAAGR